MLETLIQPWSSYLSQTQLLSIFIVRNYELWVWTFSRYKLFLTIQPHRITCQALHQNWRPPSLSELTSYWISLGLTHLGSEASNCRSIVVDGFKSEQFSRTLIEACNVKCHGCNSYYCKVMPLFLVNLHLSLAKSVI